MLVGSISELTSAHRGRVVLAGSHGGTLTARYALSRGVRGLICHDAGVGLEGAGVAGLAILDTSGAPAAAVSHATARIGDAEDMRARGILSCVNTAAAALGLCEGMAASEALARLEQAAPAPSAPSQPLDETTIFRMQSIDESVPARAYDSAAKLSPKDDGAILFTGSHGALPGADAARASKAQARFIVFNDAGVGIDQAGTRRLAALDEVSIAAACVDAFSARIGDGWSTYDTGVISAANRTADAIGVRVGMPAKALIEHITRRAVAATPNEGSPDVHSS